MAARVEIKLETCELNEYLKTRLNLARTRTLIIRAKLVLISLRTILMSRVTITR
jgi:hypothetical protein